MRSITPKALRLFAKAVNAWRWLAKVKVSFKIWQLGVAIAWLLAAMLTIAMTAVLATNVITVLASPPSCRWGHSSTEDLKSKLVVIPAARIDVIDYKNSRIYYTEPSVTTDVSGSLQLEHQYSKLSGNLLSPSESHAGCYGIIYCKEHKVALLVRRLKKEEPCTP